MANRPRVRRNGPAANPAKGEQSLALGGITYRLRPSYDAVLAIWEETGLSAEQIMHKAGMLTLGPGEIGAIVAELVRAGAEDDDVLTKGVSADRIGRLVYETGTALVQAQLSTLFGVVITGGRDEEGNAKAVAETSSKSSTSPVATAE